MILRETAQFSRLNLPAFPTDGVNVHCITLARHCQLKGVPEDMAPGLIWEMGEGKLRPGRVLSDAEVNRAVARAYGSPLPDNPNWRTTKRKPKKKEPPRNAEMVAAVLESEPLTLAEMVWSSPVALGRFAPEALTDYLVQHLFRADDWVCVGEEFDSFCTTHRRHRFGFDPQQPGRDRIELRDHRFIVPNPMAEQWGTTNEGNRSMRAKDSACKHRRYLVVEFDNEPTRDAQAALHAHLAQYAPLVLLVDSGGKSVHGWYYVEHRSRDNQRQFFNYAEKLGADPALWLKNQLSRMPGTDLDGRYQRPLFFKPANIGGLK